MTTEQRNWQFMGLFVSATMENDIAPPPREGSWLRLRKTCYKISHSHKFHWVVNATICLGITTMTNDETGTTAMVVIACEAFTALIFTLEFILGVVGTSLREHLQHWWLASLVVPSMWVILVHRLLSLYFPDNQLVMWLQWVRALEVLRALR